MHRRPLRCAKHCGGCGPVRPTPQARLFIMIRCWALLALESWRWMSAPPSRSARTQSSWPRLEQAAQAQPSGSQVTSASPFLGSSLLLGSLSPPDCPMECRPPGPVAFVRRASALLELAAISAICDDTSTTRERPALNDEGKHCQYLLNKQA